MRSSLFVVVTALTLPWSSLAQVPSIVESSTLQASPHSWKRVLRNQSTSSLVAYTLGCNPKSGLSLQDALLNAGHYIGSGESIEADVGNLSTCEASVRAAVFSDGHVEGDREFVEAIFAHRRGAYQALGDTIKLLSSLSAEHVAIADVIDRLNAERRSNGRKTPEEGVGYNSVLIQVSQILAQARDAYSLPPDYLGQKQQQPSIEDLMNTNGVSRDEARIMILNKKLVAWKSLLENHLEPSR
jgi:hypothetical protein